MAGRAAVTSSMTSPLSAREGVRWQGVQRGIAGNVDRPLGSSLQLPSPPGGEGNMAAGRLGMYPLSGRGGLLTTGVSSEWAEGVAKSCILPWRLAYSEEETTALFILGWTPRGPAMALLGPRPDSSMLWRGSSHCCPVLGWYLHGGVVFIIIVHLEWGSSSSSNTFFLCIFCAPKSIFCFICTVSGCDGGN
jgi:hypothetical protein